jgi:ketosteroid isomerase-like protein
MFSDVARAVRGAAVGVRTAAHTGVTGLAPSDAHVWSVRDGRAAGARSYASAAEALEAVGLRE